MAMKSASLKTIAAIASLSLGGAVWVQSGAFAQTTVDPLQDFDSRNSTTESSATLNQRTLFDILHRAQQGGFDFDGSVETQRNENILDAAAEFREKQRRAIEGQPESGTPEEADVTP